MISYGICTLPRCGGFYLDGLLKDVGLGAPSEYFHDPQLPGHETLESVWQEHSLNGIFAVRFHWWQRGVCKLFGDFDEAFPSTPRWVYLSREDVNSQARSWLTAEKRGTWMNPRGDYDDFPAEIIKNKERRIEHDNLKWKVWFASKEYPFLEVAYEEIVDHPQVVVSDIITWVMH